MIVHQSLIAALDRALRKTISTLSPLPPVTSLPLLSSVQNFSPLWRTFPQAHSRLFKSVPAYSSLFGPPGGPMWWVIRKYPSQAMPANANLCQPTPPPPFFHGGWPSARWSARTKIRKSNSSRLFLSKAFKAVQSHSRIFRNIFLFLCAITKTLIPQRTGSCRAAAQRPPSARVAVTQSL